MPYLLDPATDPERRAELRARADARLSGAAAEKRAPARAVDALAVLHGLASSPRTAADALALLHELQVHQVELELQAQEINESRADLETALRRQCALYDHQPAGCFVVDRRFVVQALNRAGARMLGSGRDDAIGQPLDTCFTADSARLFKHTTTRLDSGERPGALVLWLRALGGPERPVLASVGADPAGGGYLVNFIDTGELRAQVLD